MIHDVWMGDIEGTVGNTDVIVTLDDGRAYAFTAFTPEGLRAAMVAEGLGCYVCGDMMVLAALTEANIRAAVHEMEITGGLDRFGTLQEKA